MRITVIVIIKIFLSVSRINCDATVQSEDDLKQRETLRLGMLFSQKGALDFSGLIPTIEIALETIEADKTLPFTFAYTYNDSMVSQLCAHAASRKATSVTAPSTSIDLLNK